MASKKTGLQQDNSSAFSFGFNFKLIPRNPNLKNKVDHVYLECTTGGHNKFYDVWIDDTQPGIFTVRTKWGKIGTFGSYGLKGTYSVHVTAMNSLLRIVKQQINKGYVIVQTKH